LGLPAGLAYGVGVTWTALARHTARRLAGTVVLLGAVVVFPATAGADAAPGGAIRWPHQAVSAFRLQTVGDGRHWIVSPPAGSWASLAPGLSGLAGLGSGPARVETALVLGGERPRLSLHFAGPVTARIVAVAAGVEMRWQAVPDPAVPQAPAGPRPLAAGVVADIVGGAGGASLMLAWLLKKLKGDTTESSKTLEVIPVSETKALHVVERGAKILLIEVEGERSQVISQVSDPNLVAYLKSAKGSLKGSAFLAQYLKRAATGHPGDDGATPPKPAVAAKPEPAPRTEPPEPPRPAPKAAVEPPKPRPQDDGPPPARGGFDFTVDDSTPVAPPKPPKPAEPAREAEVLPARAEVRPVVARSDAANAIMQKLEKAMDRFADNTGDGMVQSSDMLPSAIKISEPVTMALREVVDRQRSRLDTIKESKRQEELEKTRVEGLLRRKREVEDKIGKIQEMLGRIDQDSAHRNQSNVETSLLATSRDLGGLEDELSKIMTDPGVIKYLLAERDDFQSDSRNPLDSIVNSVRTIERQRKQIAAIRHTREQAEAERRRIVLLLIRKNELETAIDEIKQVIRQIEETNAEIVRMDPYAMPETVPIVAMNELRRLEFEMNTILADPGVAKKLAEAPGEMLGGESASLPQLPA
jgi:hypothetical protein